MNSDVINSLIHTINPTANNSANYVKQIPYIEPMPDLLEIVTNKVKDLKQSFSENDVKKCKEIHFDINAMITQIYQ